MCHVDSFSPWGKAYRILIAFLFLSNSLSAQSLASLTPSHNPFQTQEKQFTLEQELKRLEKQYRISIFYESDLIDRKVTKETLPPYENPKEALQHLLHPFHLDLKELKPGVFVIIKSTPIKPTESLVPKSAATFLAHVPHRGLSPVSTRPVRSSVAILSGRVVDPEGEGIPGVNVLEKGTTNGTITDVDGRFTLNVSEGTTLVFSAVGYLPQEIAVAGRAALEITLEEDVKALEEVVVVGYGTMKKSDLTGAVGQADLQALQNSNPVNVMQSLKGVIPGLNIGQVTRAGDNPTISIRGQNSISGTTSPLIVLDGIIYRGAFTDINPNDIESIDVLKDASSAAIYGSQGANGVILITTKSAAKNLGKPIIEYNGTYSLQRLINNKLKRLDREGFITQLEDVYISQSRMGDDLTQTNPDFDVVSIFRDESVAAGYVDGTNVDWWDLLSYDHPYIQNHNLSLRGRGDRSSYFISYGFTDQKNLVRNDTYQRHSLRINLDADVTNWLKLGTQSYFAASDFSGNNPGFGALNTFPALVNPYNTDGTLRRQVYLGGINPLLYINNPDKDTRYNLNGNFYTIVSVPWVQGLSYRVNFSNNLTLFKDFNFDPYANNFLGQGNKRNSWTTAMTLDNIVTYKRDFGPHSFNGTFLYGVEERTYENTDAAAGFFTDQTLNYNSLELGQADQQRVYSDAWRETSLYTMGRLVYAYNSRYIFTGTIRRDGFSGFSDKYKYAIFPSAAVAWNISDEPFFKGSLVWVDNLKLRYSFGQGGNRTVGRYQTLATMGLTLPSDLASGYLYGDGATGERGQAVRTNSNQNLKWETTTASNFGIDFSFLQGLISGSYNFYASQTKDLLYNIAYPSVNGTYPNGTGSITVPTNIGKLQNTGHELSVAAYPVSKGDFSWSVAANFARNRNKVNTILGIDADSDGKEDDLIASGLFIGEPLNTIYDYEIIGMWQVDDFQAGDIPTGFTYGTYKIADLDNSGTYTADKDRKILGYRDPSYTVSFINTFRYKNFELKAFLYSIQGGKNRYLGQPAAQLPIPDHLTNSSYLKFDYWTPENPDAKYRQLGAYTNALGPGFSPYVSRSFIRMQELSLAYNLPAPLLSRYKINNARIWVSGYNLFTLTQWDGYDPEADQGLTYDFIPDVQSYPTMKSYTVGLNLAF
ncbi:TonB-linked outer membrane protein, SusC/RagA family [Catalinimonas alkaloidigena]|uniref:TonB-linked outer membrane protein, SusC/RagA family n=1 Tax=Catalinimonas alkaloidigena TaxID=1075417 RepID=A0A1G9HS17_9BACT|nr:TonB-dependent receptor [Catalinimonas alkaloidigena]SDL15606.1 TonB-linked outer membrane protein, SusC/RagA family [Catalinimonas alkaloidigena]